MQPTPIVIVLYKTGCALEPIVIEIVAKLPEIVSSFLSEGHPEHNHLNPSDVTVCVQPFGDFDVNVKDLEIIIRAHEYIITGPSRLDNRADEVANDIIELLSNHDRKISGSVRILRQPIDFKEF